jgi:hypothetical protein
MGVLDRARRASVSIALLLLLAAAGSGVAAPQAEGGGTGTGGVDDAVVEPPQVAASVSLRESAAPVAPALGAPVRVGAIDAVAGAVAGVDVPDVLLRAYRSAVTGSPASCHLQVSLLAAIGEVETGSLAGRPLDRRHRTSVLGPVLDGVGFAAVPDTDGGRWDGDRTWDRAVGPMQFVPATWKVFGVDGDGDGVADPQDVEDAAASAAGFLCHGGRDLAAPATLRAAVLAYNHSTAYLDLVSTYQQRYAQQGLDRTTLVTGAPLRLQAIEATALAMTPAAPAVSHAAPATPAPAAARVTPSGGPTQTPPTAATRPARATAAPTASARPTTTTPGTPTGTPTAASTVPAPVTPTGHPTSTPASTPSVTPTPTSPATPAPTTTPTTTPTSPAPTACPVVVTTDGVTPTATPTALPTSAATPAPLGSVPVAGSTDGLVCPPCDPTASPIPQPSPTAVPSLGTDGLITCVPVVPPTTSPSSGQ